MWGCYSRKEMRVIKAGMSEWVEGGDYLEGVGGGEKGRD